MKEILDWYQIEFLYPKAFKHFTKRMFPNTGVASVSLLSCYDHRKLYSFFDREGIFLNVEILSMNKWNCTVHFKNGTSIGVENTYNGRDMAEIVGFEKCFIYLENKLLKCGR